MVKKIVLVILANLITFAWADSCEIVVNSNDLMRYDLKQMEIKASCETIKVTLNNLGRMPRSIMGHNIVITKSADFRGVAADGVRATLKNEHIKPNDERIIAHSRMIGPGESDAIIIKPSQFDVNENYVFFCSFPSHSSSMVGKLVFVP